MPNSGPNGEWWVLSPEDWKKIVEPVLAFQLWYGDGSCVTGAGSWDDIAKTWDDAPREGVQILMLHHPDVKLGPQTITRRNIIMNRDEYTMLGRQATKLGLMIDTDEFRRIMRMALDDPWRPEYAWVRSIT